MARADRVFPGKLASDAHGFLAHDVCIRAICQMLVRRCAATSHCILAILPLLQVLKFVGCLSDGFCGILLVMHFLVSGR